MKTVRLHRPYTITPEDVLREIIPTAEYIDIPEELYNTIKRTLNEEQAQVIYEALLKYKQDLASTNE